MIKKYKQETYKRCPIVFQLCIYTKITNLVDIRQKMPLKKKRGSEIYSKDNKEGLR